MTTTTKWIAVQGDRDAEGMEEAGRRFGTEVAKRPGWGCNLGSAGDFVMLIGESGVPCKCHETSSVGKSKIPEGLPNVSVVHCESWEGRLGTGFLKANAFGCFAGRQGTIAHLVPFIAHVMKGDMKNGGKPRRIALIGWSTMKILALCELMDIDYNAKETKKWLRTYTLRHVHRAVDFLTAE